jgi:hypothetical protein
VVAAATDRAPAEGPVSKSVRTPRIYAGCIKRSGSIDRPFPCGNVQTLKSSVRVNSVGVHAPLHQPSTSEAAARDIVVKAYCRASHVALQPFSALLFTAAPYRVSSCATGNGPTQPASTNASRQVHQLSRSCGRMRPVIRSRKSAPPSTSPRQTFAVLRQAASMSAVHPSLACKSTSAPTCVSTSRISPHRPCLAARRSAARPSLH